MLSLVEITAFRLDSKSCKGFFSTSKFSPMRALEFIKGHVIYNLAYTNKFQLKNTYLIIENNYLHLFQSQNVGAKQSWKILYLTSILEKKERLSIVFSFSSNFLVRYLYLAYSSLKIVRPLSITSPLSYQELIISTCSFLYYWL